MTKIDNERALAVRRSELRPSAKHGASLAYHFGRYELDETVSSLQEDGTEIELEPLPYRLLRYLIRNRDRVVPKEELLEALWPGVTVSDAALASAINAVRKAVGDSGTEQHTISTLRGRGYRFVAEVSSNDTSRPSFAPKEAAIDATSQLIGRDAELASLRETFAQVETGRCKQVFVTGEPGIGKTSICEDFSTYAARRSARVLWGRCHEDASAPYRPWLEVLRSLQRIDGSVYEERAAERARELIALLTRHTTSEDSNAQMQYSPYMRLELFDAVSDCIESVCRVRTVVIVIDDLHWADSPSLSLLQFLLRARVNSRLMIVVAFRDVAPAPRGAFAQALGAFSGLRSVAPTLQLARWSRREVEDYVRFIAGDGLVSSLVREIENKSGGNPLFVRELTRHVLAPGISASAGSLGDRGTVVPDSVARVLEYRLAGLSETAVHILRICAAYGPSTPNTVMRAIGEVKDRDLGSILTEVSETGLVVLDDASSATFSHAVVRDAIYAATRIEQRAAIHQAIAEFLETESDAFPEQATPAAELAHHFRLSLSNEGRRSALRYTRMAAEAAKATGAFDEAARHYKSGLKQLTAFPDSDALERCDMLLDYAEASTVAGPVLATFEAIESAWKIARSKPDTARTARTALAMSSWIPPVLENRRGLEMLQGALAVADAISPATRARLLGQTALLLNAAGEPIPAREFLREARSIADSLNDPHVQCVALHHQLVVLEQSAPSPDVEKRLELAGIVHRNAERLGHPGITLEAMRHRIGLALESGDATGLDRLLEEFERNKPYGRPRAHRHLTTCYSAMRSLLTGQFEKARELIVEAELLADPFDISQSRFVPTSQRYLLPPEFLDPNQVENEVGAITREFAGVDAWKAALAGLHSRLGQREASRVIFDELAARNFDTVRHNMLFLVSFVTLAEVAWRDGIREHADKLYTELLPHAGSMVTLGWGIACYGPVSHYLGLLADLSDEPKRSEDHFEDALSLETRFAAKPYELATKLAFANHLLRRDVSGNAHVERARRLLLECIEIADTIGVGNQRALAAQMLDRTTK